VTPARGIKKDSNLTVEPIRKKTDIKSITRSLKSHPRNYLLWVMGINNWLRANDLVRIKYSQIEGLKAGAAIKLRYFFTRLIKIF
jgi:hypothetical protein